MTGCTVRRYDQLDISPETIEQELRPAVCERRQTDSQTDFWTIIVQMAYSRALTLPLLQIKKLMHLLLLDFKPISKLLLYYYLNYLNSFDQNVPNFAGKLNQLLVVGGVMHSQGD